MSQAERDAESESVENCDNFALFAPRDELPTIAGGNRAREQCFSHPNLPDIENESEPEHDSSQPPANESESGDEGEDDDEEEEEEEELEIVNEKIKTNPVAVMEAHEQRVFGEDENANHNRGDYYWDDWSDDQSSSSSSSSSSRR